MKEIQQLIKKEYQTGNYQDIFPKTFLDAVVNRETGVSLDEILTGFNMYFLTYLGGSGVTRLQIPDELRRQGLFITYVLFDKTTVIEWYDSDDISDEAWQSDANWRKGSNMLVGDISISSEGNWVVNGVDTGVKATGDRGITPVLRIYNNKLQVSYNEGGSYVDINDTPVYTQFRVNNNHLEQSVDLGQTWTVVSDYIAAWFKFTGTAGDSQADNVGKIQISRDNGATWSDLSGMFTNSLHIKGYVATVSELPLSAVQGDIYGVGPTYDPSDTEHTNPIYQLYVKDSTGWVNNGRFTSISAGVVQELGDSETATVSQKGISDKIYEISGYVNTLEFTQGVVTSSGIFEVIPNRITSSYFKVLNTDITIKTPTGIFIRTVAKYDNDYNFIENSTAVSETEKTLPKGFIYRISLCKSDTSANIVPSEAIGILSGYAVHSDSISKLIADVRSANDRISSLGFPLIYQGALASGTVIVQANRVYCDYIDAKRDITIETSNGIMMRLYERYDYSYRFLNNSGNIDVTKVTLPKGNIYRVVFCKTDLVSNISPDEVLPNTRIIYDKYLDNSIDTINSEIDLISNVKGSVGLFQGFISQNKGNLVPLSSRVSSGYINAMSSVVTIEALGNYAIRTINRYISEGNHDQQIVNASLLDSYELPAGYLYRITFVNKLDLNKSITPSEVSPYVKSTQDLPIVVDIQTLKQDIEYLREINMLLDDFNGAYNQEHYYNMSGTVSNGRYNLPAGWTNALKDSRIYSFQNYCVKYDINVDTATTNIYTATEVTQQVLGSYYGSCGVIDIKNSMMYILAPTLFRDSVIPDTSTAVATKALTNIDPLCNRYLVEFGKRDRNVFIAVTNYYTGVREELVKEDLSNNSLAGSGYDTPKIACDTVITLNSISVGIETDVDLLFLGDSITDGRGIPLVNSWAYKVANKFTTNYMIASRSGGRIDQALKFIQDWITTIRPKYTIISIGINGGNTSAKFDSLWNSIKDRTIPIISTIYNASSSFNNITGADWIEYNNKILSIPCRHIRFDIASSANKYNPVWNALDPSYTLVDSVHPTSNGSILLYNRALSDLSDIIL